LAQLLHREYSTDINEEWTAIKGANTHSAQKSTGTAQNQKCKFLQVVEGRNKERMKKLAIHTRANLQEYRAARMAAKNMQRNNLWKTAP
jgi:hypothetical protein